MYIWLSHKVQIQAIKKTQIIFYLTIAQDTDKNQHLKCISGNLSQLPN